MRASCTQQAHGTHCKGCAVARAAQRVDARQTKLRVLVRPPRRAHARRAQPLRVLERGEPDGTPTRTSANAPRPPADTGKSTGQQGAAAAQRIRIAVGEATNETCELRVRVIYQADGAPLGVAFTELTVHLLDTPQIRSEHRTDEQGAAEFIFAGGSGSTVIAQTATGATGSAVLDRAAQVELTIVVKPNALAIGTVIGPDHHGVADADIVLLPWQRDDHHPLDVWRIGRSGQDGSFRIPIEGGGRIGAAPRSA